MGLKPERSLPGFSDIEDIFLKESLRPFSILKKFNYKGAVHDLSFKTHLKKIPEMEAALISLARDSGYTPDDIGGYLRLLNGDEVFTVNLICMLFPNLQKKRKSKSALGGRR